MDHVVSAAARMHPVDRERQRDVANDQHKPSGAPHLILLATARTESMEPEAPRPMPFAGDLDARPVLLRG